jgi:hypothetical protein
MADDALSAPDSRRAELARAVARATSDYLLRALRQLTDLHQGELITAIVCQAIIAANTAHLNHPGCAALAKLPPDEMRRPISILSLAGSLGLPFETTRRHVARLTDAGVCRRVRGGVIVPAAVLDNPAAAAAAETNLANVQRLVRGLRRAGLPLD